MSEDSTVNTAGPGSFVGAQAQQIWNSEFHFTFPDDPPERHFEVGAHYLDHGVPRKAREHIEHAMARGHDGPRVRFHLILAILSQRSYRDLDKGERARLRGLTVREETATTAATGDWHGALGVVSALVSCVDGSGGDPDTAVAGLKSLPRPQQDLALRHLSLVLTGGMKQGVWYKYRRQALRDSSVQERRERVWAYFEPEPARARARPPRPSTTTGWGRFGAALTAAASLFVAGALVRFALGHGDMGALLSCLALLVLVPLAGRYVAVWDHQRRRALDALQEQGGSRSSRPPPKGGFTDRVGRTFDHYFTKYAPDPADRSAWTGQTAGVRRALREEVVRVYRESAVRSGQVNWLIRFMARDVRRRWLRGEPLTPHGMHSVDTATKFVCAALCLSSAVAAASVIGAAFQYAPLNTVGCVVAAVPLLWFAVPLWSRMYSERLRYEEEKQEQQATLQAREAEYERWKGKTRRAQAR